MTFSQFLDGQTQRDEGADFGAAVKAAQVAARAFVDHRKVPLAPRQTAAAAFLELVKQNAPSLEDRLRGDLGYGAEEARAEVERALTLGRELLQRPFSAAAIPLGPCLILGSWSSPVERVCQTALTALTLGNSVILWTGAAASAIYCQLAGFLTAAGFAPGLVTVTATQDREAEDTLVSHPSVRAIHGAAHFYEGRILRTLSFDANKKIKLFFGGHNPVIFAHDAPLDRLSEWVPRALRYHARGEERFQRWFVQEKNYSLFIDEFKKVFAGLSHADLGAFPDAAYKEAYLHQMRDLTREKGWLTSPGNPLIDERTPALQAALDFNNCSAWQQSEMLGPVITITRFKNSAEAVKFANTTLFANAAAVIAGTPEKALETAALLQMPRVYINELPTPARDQATHASYDCGRGNDVSDFEFFQYPKTIG